MRARFTREGIRFIVLLGIVGFAAYNTHNNLIFLMLSAGLATVVVGFLSGLYAARALSVRPSELGDVYAGSLFTERLELENRSALLPGFGIAVDGGASRVGFVPKRGRALCAVARQMPHRGLHHGEPIRLATGFPFGLFRFERVFEVPREILVFPAVRPIDPSALLAPGRGGSGSGGRPGRGEEFFRLRDYESGDAVHHIHWRTTAKVGELMVRELGDAREERLALTFEPSLAPGEDFERVVTATASIARYLADASVAFRFFSPELELPARLGRDHLRAVLAHLAIASPNDGSVGAWRSRVERARALGETVLIVSEAGNRFSADAVGSVRRVSTEALLREGATA